MGEIGSLLTGVNGSSISFIRSGYSCGWTPFGSPACLSAAMIAEARSASGMAITAGEGCTSASTAAEAVTV